MRIKYVNIMFYHQLYRQIENSESLDPDCVLWSNMSQDELAYITMPCLGVKKCVKNNVKPHLIKYDMLFGEKSKHQTATDEHYVYCNLNQQILGISLGEVIKYMAKNGDIPVIDSPIKTTSIAKLDGYKDEIRSQFNLIQD